MRVFVQKDERCQGQYLIAGKNTRAIMMNVVKMVYGEKFCPFGEGGIDEMRAWENADDDSPQGRKFLVVDRDYIDTLIHALEAIEMNIIVVEDDNFQPLKFEERLVRFYGFNWLAE